MKKLLSLKNKGFTVAEVVVAMTVIALVSMATSLVVSKARQVSTNSMYYYEARKECSNAIECFKYSETEYQFYISLFQFSNNFYKNEDDEYISETGMYKLIITVSYSETKGTKDIFDATCYNSSNKRIFTANYLRG